MRNISRPISTASFISRRACSSSTRPSSASIGMRFAPLRKIRSPLIEQIQSSHATSRKPVLRPAESLISPSTETTTSTLTRCCSPRSRGHQSAGWGRSTRHATSFCPAATVIRFSATTLPSTKVWIPAAQLRLLSSRALSRRWARSTVASWQRTRSESIRTDPVSER